MLAANRVRTGAGTRQWAPDTESREGSVCRSSRRRGAGAVRWVPRPRSDNRSRITSDRARARLSVRRSRLDPDSPGPTGPGAAVLQLLDEIGERRMPRREPYCTRTPARSESGMHEWTKPRPEHRKSSLPNRQPQHLTVRSLRGNPSSAPGPLAGWARAAGGGETAGSGNQREVSTSGDHSGTQPGRRVAAGRDGPFVPLRYDAQQAQQAYLDEFGPSMFVYRRTVDDMLGMFGMQRAEIPRSFEPALGPTLAEELRIMVDRRRAEFRMRPLRTRVLYGIARDNLPAGAHLNHKVSREVRRIEEHYSETHAALGGAARGSDVVKLVEELKADSRDLRRLRTEQGSPQEWMNKHARKWVTGYAANLECRDRRSIEAERERQARSTEMPASEPALKQRDLSAPGDLGI